MDEPEKNRGAEKTKHKANEHALAVLPAIDAAVASGAKGLTQIAGWLNANGIATARHNIWRTETVRRVLRRLARLGRTEFAVRTGSEGQGARQADRRAREQAALDRNVKRRAELRAAGILKD